MQCLIALLKKEWRDARALVLASAALAPLLSIALQVVFLHFHDPALSARFVVPGMVALLVGAIASELVADEVSTRRIETLAALPASPLFVWLAKCLFLVVVAAAFALWTFGCELLIFAVARGSQGAGALFGAAPESMAMLLLVVPLASCVLLFSTIVDGGLAAFVGGVMIVIGLHYGLVQIARDHEFAKRLTVDRIAMLEAGLSIACLAGSAAAFRLGELHLASRVRRIVIGLGVAVAVLAVPATAGAMALRRWSSSGPDNPDARIVEASLSDDETLLALGVTKSADRERGAVWIVDLSTNRVTLLDEGFSGLTPHGWVTPPWSKEGRLRVVRWSAEGYLKSQGVSLVEIDPRTRDVSTPRDFDSFFSKQRVFGWAQIEPFVGNPWVKTITWSERGLRREIRKPDPKGKWKFARNDAAVLAAPGQFLWVDDGKLLREDMVTGASVVLAPGGVARYELSPDGTRALVFLGEEMKPRVIDVDDGHVVLELNDDPPRTVSWASGHHGNRLLVQSTVDHYEPTLIDLHDVTRVPLPRLSFERVIEVARDGRMFLVRWDGALEVVDPAGRRLRRLWEPPK